MDRCNGRDLGEDAIDFPCAPGWVQLYARQGLTADYPPDYYRRGDLEEEVAELRAQVERCRERISPGYMQSQWRAQLWHLEKKVDKLAAAKALREEGGFEL